VTFFPAAILYFFIHWGWPPAILSAHAAGQSLTFG
jgi:hypothetical protein